MFGMINFGVISCFSIFSDYSISNSSTADKKNQSKDSVETVCQKMYLSVFIRRDFFLASILWINVDLTRSRHFKFFYLM